MRTWTEPLVLGEVVPCEPSRFGHDGPNIVSHETRRTPRKTSIYFGFHSWRHLNTFSRWCQLALFPRSRLVRAVLPGVRHPAIRHHRLVPLESFLCAPLHLRCLFHRCTSSNSGWNLSR